MLQRKLINIQKYDLPDFSIYESTINTYHTWQPDQTIIVLGASNNPEDSLIAENVIGDNIPVYKRPSGGQAVVLTPETLVISVLRNGVDSKQPKWFFNEINYAIIVALQKLGIKSLSHRGISDIVINEKKILGSSIYRNKEKLFYHAVLNISESPEIFEKYLKHPVKEPDYRGGRSHRDFVTSIRKEGYLLNVAQISEAIITLKPSFIP